jgi:hypothetical protein
MHEPSDVTTYLRQQLKVTGPTEVTKAHERS